MDKIIIFATIIFQGEVKNIHYEQVDFKSEKACYEYMEKHNKHFSNIVDEIRRNLSPQDRLLVIGCSAKKNLL